MKLYEIADEYRVALAELEDGDGVLTIACELDRIKDNFHDKACNVALYIKELQMKKSSVKKRIEELNLKSKHLEEMEDSLRFYLLTNMQKVGLKRAENSYITVSMRKSNFVSVSNESLIPDRFFDIKVEKTLNKALLKEKIKEGAYIEGVSVQERDHMIIK